MTTILNMAEAFAVLAGLALFAVACAAILFILLAIIEDAGQRDGWL